MESVEVEWYGPYKIDTVVEEFFENEDFGLYMITRKWGDAPEKILYLGMTYKRDFSQRLTEHWRDWLSEVKGTIKIRVGYLAEKKSSEKRLRHVENLLLCWHSPEYNTTGVKYYRGRDLAIINSGRRGPLDKKITSDELEPL